MSHLIEAFNKQDIGEKLENKQLYKDIEKYFDEFGSKFQIRQIDE